MNTKQVTNELSLSIHYDCKMFNYVDDVEEIEVDRFGRVRSKSVRSHIGSYGILIWNRILESDYEE